MDLVCSNIRGLYVTCNLNVIAQNRFNTILVDYGSCEYATFNTTGNYDIITHKNICFSYVYYNHKKQVLTFLLISDLLFQ